MASLLLTDNRKGKCAMTKREKGLVAALSVVTVIVSICRCIWNLLSDHRGWQNLADASINGVNIQEWAKEAAQTVEQKFEEDYKDTAVTVELDGQQVYDERISNAGDGCFRRNWKSIWKGMEIFWFAVWVGRDEMGKAEEASYDVQPTALIQMRWKELYRHPAFRITTPCRILHMK